MLKNYKADKFRFIFLFINLTIYLLRDKVDIYLH